MFSCMIMLFTFVQNVFTRIGIPIEVDFKSRIIVAPR